MTSPPIVFFIHGFNTFGDDRIHAGPFDFGPMSKAWQPALEAAGFEFHSLKEMGFGFLDEQADRAVKQIERIVRARSTAPSGRPADLHLLGHSMGGLVARGVAQRLRDLEVSTSSQIAFSDLARVRSVITIGTPHLGSVAADGALDLEMRAPRLYRLMKIFGYDISKRREAVAPLYAENINDFNLRHPPLPGVDYVSLVSSVKKHQLGLPYRVIYALLHSRENPEPSDGLIFAESQLWGRSAGHFELDHMAQVGGFSHPNPFEHRRARRELARALQTVEDIIRDNSSF